MAMEVFRLMGTVAISKDQALKDIKAIQTQAEKTSTAMGKSFTKFSGYVEKHSAQIKKAGKYMTVFGGIATAAFALSVKSAANFETQLANVSTMLDESAMKILPEYRKGLQSLSVDFGESTETLSKGLYDILSASIPPAEALGVLEVSAKAAAAGITDTGVAADAITTILNSYGFSADQAGMVSDKLFAIVKGGKTCITGESRILLSDGRYERIDKLINGAEILTWTGKGFIPMQAKYHALGKKKIIHIKTQFGREIRTTAEHPYLTPNGWKEIEKIKIGEKIAIPSSLPVFGNIEPKWKSLPRLLGYIISEGYICRGTPIISNSSKEIIDDIKSLVNDIGLKTSLNKKRSGNVNIGIVTHLGSGNIGENPLTNELKRLGIWGNKSKTKFVPMEVFQWKPKYILEFLEGLFNGDGYFRKLEQKNTHISQREITRDENGRFKNIKYKKVGKREVKKFQIGYSSASKQLIFDISHLLLRFGINGAISYGKNSYDGIYSWVTSRFSEISQFVSLINLKRNTVEEFKDYRQISHQLRDISSGIYFAKVKSKIEEPEEEVYDLTVPKFHNFVANDIIAHNTFAELAPSIGKVAATASMSGLSFDDLGASIATMTRAGIRTEEVMTAINGVLIAFLKPTDDAIEAAAKFGLELNTNTLRTEGLTGVMDKLKDASAEQLAAIFPNIRGLKGMAAALGDAEGYARDYALMLDSAGLTQEAFAKQSATLNFKLGQLKEMFNVIKVTIGTALVPAVEDIIKKVMGVLKRVKEWTEANPKLTATIVKWAAGIGVLMLGLGPLLMLLPGIVTALPILSSGVIAVSGAFAGLATVLGLTAPQLFAIGVAITLVTKATYGWIDAIKESKRIKELEVESARLTAAALKKLQEAYHMIDEEVREYTKTHMLSHVVLERAAQDARDLAKIQYQLISTGRALVELTKETATPFTDLASAIKVVNTVAGESGITVDSLNKEMETLTETFELSQKYITENNRSVLDTITYYNSMISLMNNLASSLNIELSLLEAGTEEYNKKAEEIKKNKKSLTEMKAALEALMAPLTGLDLISAKMTLLGDSTEDTKKKIELLNEKAILLQQALDEAIPDTAAWWEAKIAFEGNQIAIDGLRAKLEELTDEEKEAIAHAKKLADAYKTIEDKIYELTHTPMETAIRRLDEQKQEYIDLGVAIGVVNRWYDEQIKKLEEELNPALDDTTKKLKEVGEAGEETAKVTQFLGKQSVIAFDYMRKGIDNARVSLSTFTTEAVAAAITQIKMHYYPEMVRLTNLIREAGHIRGLREWYEADLKVVMGKMTSDIDTLKYGFAEYNKEVGKLPSSYESARAASINATKSMVSGWVTVANAANRAVQATASAGGGGGVWGSTIHLASGGPIQSFTKAIKFLAAGGGIGTDTVPIMATPGEYLIKKSMVDFIRRTGMVTGGLVEAIQAGLPTPNPIAFADGGLVGGRRDVDSLARGVGSLVIEKGAIVIQTPKVSERDGQLIFSIVERKAAERGMFFERR